MPLEWNNILCVTKDELIPDHVNCLDTLKSEIRRYKDKPYGIKKVRSGGNGREMLIAFDSLRQDIQLALGDPRRISNPMELFYKVDKGAVDYYTTYRFEDGMPLSIEHQDEYITNASVLAAAIALKAARENERRSKGGSCTGVMDTICRDVVLFNKVLHTKHQASHTLPASAKRFKEAFKLFATPPHGDSSRYHYESLISGKLRNENRRKVTDQALALLNDLFATQTHKPTRTEVAAQYDAFLSGYMEVLNADTGELHDPKDYKPISKGAILTWLGRWDEKIATHRKRSGNRQVYMGAYKTYHSLDKPAYAGSIISIDDRQPPFNYDGNNRPWFYMGIDLASECWVAAVHGKSKEGIIKEFYRKLVRNYHKWGLHLPAELECEASLNSSFTGTFLQEGRMFSYVRMEANKARAKRIERYFKDLRYGNEKQRDGWIARHYAGAEANQPGPWKVPVVPYNKIIEGCLKDIEDWNNAPHSVYTDKSRWQVFMEMQNPNLQPTNWNAILPHLGYMTKTSCQLNGIIHLENEEYLLGMDGEVLLGERLITMMRRVAGREIDVYWLDDDNGKIIKAQIFLRNEDTLMCEAVLKPRYNRARIEQTEADRKAIEIVSAYGATIEAYAQRKAAQISDVIVIDKRPAPERMFVMDELQHIRRREAEPLPTAEVLAEVDDEADYTEPAYSGGKQLIDRF